MCVGKRVSLCYEFWPMGRQRLREAMGPSEIGRNGMGLSARRSAAPQHPLAVVLGEQAGVHAAQQVQIWSLSGVALAVSVLGPAGHAACKVMRVTIEFALKPGCCCMHCVQHSS